MKQSGLKSYPRDFLRFDPTFTVGESTFLLGDVLAAGEIPFVRGLGVASAPLTSLPFGVAFAVSFDVFIGGIV